MIFSFILLLWQSRLEERAGSRRLHGVPSDFRSGDFCKYGVKNRSVIFRKNLIFALLKI